MRALFAYEPERRKKVDKTCHALMGMWVRTLKGYPFRNRLDEELTAEIKQMLRAPLEEGMVGGRKFRREEEENADGSEQWTTRDDRLSVGLGGVEHLSVHLLPQPLTERTEGYVEGARRVVKEYERRFEFARDKRFGWYTSAAWLMGSGCQFSVLMQLGGLRASGLLWKTDRALHEWGFKLRPLEEAGKNRSAGGWHWLDTRISMGLGDWRLFYGLLRAAGEVAEAECNARERLMEKDRVWVLDQVGRAVGTLEGALQMGYREGLELLTWLELAAMGGWLPLETTPWEIFGVVGTIRPGHVPAPGGEDPGKKLAVRMARAGYLKYHFHKWRNRT